MNPEYLLALDSSGKIIGHNRSLQLLLESGKHRKRILGQSFETFFNASFDRIGSFVRTRPSEERAITTVENSRLLFLLASPPPTVVQSKSVVQYKESPLTKLSGGDPSLDRQIERGTKLLNSPVNILLTGETGTGKEYFARAMHESSERRSHPYIAVNCAAIPEPLIESELFGYTQGSFSGANQKGKIGLIQEADRGTLFLDEIGDMPIHLQARLLRVLAEREVLPIGATKPIPVNIRVISATHCDLIDLVKKGKFRDDLYYRINGAQISLPALRDRKDLAWMIQKMLEEDSFLGAHKIEIADDVKYILLSYKWPGNLRELKNVIHYCKTICNEPIITLSDLPDSFLEKEIFQRDIPYKSTPGEATQIKELLEDFGGNITQVAKHLNVSRMTIYRRMKKWGMKTSST
jgi:transcriptional regulator of acetoin/glycerol metabolism